MAENSLDITQGYLEAINKAISIHTDNAVKNLAFDRTETAEITDVSGRAYGEYVVNNGSISYHAFSENTNYTVGTKVYVTIPNGDYTQEKQIINKVSAGNEKPLEYISPLDSYSPIEGNLIEDSSAKMDQSDEIFYSLMEVEGATVSENYNSWEEGAQEQLLANWNLEKEEKGKQYILLYHSKNLQELDKYNQVHKYFGISADFKTLLKNMTPTTGEYGLDIYITYSYTSQDTSSERVYNTIRHRLSSKDMIGSIYNFKTFYNQQALFRLDVDESKATKIHYVGIFFYQEGDFKNANGELPTHYELPDGSNVLLPCNIFMRGLYAQFGDDLITDEVDNVTIYTTNGLFYDSAQLNDKAIEKTVRLRWMHQDYENTTSTKMAHKEVTNLSKIDSESDLPIYAKIHWFKSSIHTLDEYRSQKASNDENNDRIYNLINKYKETFENRDAWLHDYQELAMEYQDDIQSHYDEFAAKYEQLKQANSTDTSISKEEMYDLIQELNLNRYDDYYYNEQTEMFYLTPNGEKYIDQSISRLKRTQSSADTDLLADDEAALAGAMWEPLAADVFYTTYMPDRKLATCAVKCIIEYGPYFIDDEGNNTKKIDRTSQYYRKLESNILYFTNMTMIPDAAGSDLAKGVQISYNDRTNGNYPLYDADAGRIINLNQSSMERVLTADLISRYTGKSYLNGNETIIWKVPRTNTMINISAGFSEERTEVVNENQTVDNIALISLADEDFRLSLNRDELFNNWYYIIWRAIDSSAHAINTLSYWINDYFVKNAINNTVYCFLIKNGEAMTGSTTMQFSQRGTCGTDYTFTFSLGDLVDEDWNVVGPAEQVLTIGDPYWRIINFNLYDGEGEQINLTEEEKNEIIKLWVDWNENGYYSGLLNAKKVLDYKYTGSSYRKNEELIYRFDKVAVRVKEESDIQDCQFITLAASVKNPAVTTYNNRLYQHDNVLFTQYLPLRIRVSDEYNIEGSGIIYYDDKGAINQTKAVRYSLIGHDADAQYKNFFPDVEAFKNRVEDLEFKINSLLETANTYDYAIGRTVYFVFTDYYHELVDYDQIITDIDTGLDQCNNRKENVISIWDIAEDNGSITPKTRENYRFLIDTFDSCYSLLEEKKFLIQNYQATALAFKEDTLLALDGRFEVHAVNTIFIQDGDLEYKEIDTTAELMYYPSFESDGHYLTPPVLLIDNLSHEVCINSVLNGIVVYTLPLLLLQNKYQIPALNRWNGKMFLDEENNAVMAATIAAGHKDDNNTFTGIIMGDIERRDNDRNRLEVDSGLFGYHENAQAFGFQTDGTGFIGKNTTGRINFNGINGTISSANYSIDRGNDQREGTLIDLDNGDIDMYGYGNTYQYNEETKRWTSSTNNTTMASHIHLGTQGSTQKPYFQIEVPRIIDNTNSTVQKQNLLLIDKNDYYLQTADYSVDRNTGLKIDLKKGTFDSRGQLTILGGIGSKIEFGNSTDYIHLGMNNAGSYFEMVSSSKSAASIIESLNSIRNSLISDFSGYTTPTVANYQLTNENGLRSVLQSWSNTITDLQNQLSNMPTTLAEKQNELSIAVENYRVAKQAYDMKMAQIAEYDRILAMDETAAIADAESKYSIWQNKISEAASLEQNYNNSVSNAENYYSVYLDLVETKTNLEQSYLEAVNTLETLISELDELQTQQTEISGQLVEAQNNYNRVQLLIQEETNNPTEPDPTDPSAKTHEEILAELEEELAVYQDRINTLSPQLAEINGQVNSKQLEVNAAQDARDSLYIEINGNPENDISSIDDRVANALADYNNAVAARDAAYTTWQTKENEVTVAEHNYGQAVNTRDNLFAMKQEAEIKRNELTSSNEIEETYFNAEEQLNLLQADYDSLVNQQTSISQQLADLQLRYESASTDLENYLTTYRRYVAATENGVGDGHIRISNTGSRYFEAGSNFWVDNRGNIMSSGGTIAGWNIYDNRLVGGRLTLYKNGSLYGPSWHIDENGNAYFNNVFQAGSATGYNSGTGLYVNGGSAYFNGDIYARHGYFSGSVYATDGVFNGTVYATDGTFTGTINASTINGGTISGSTISGATITGGYIRGTRIQADGYVVCSGLSVGGTSYSMTSIGNVVHDLQTRSQTVITSLHSSFSLTDSMGGAVTGSVSVWGGESSVASVTSYGKTKITFLGRFG